MRIIHLSSTSTNMKFVVLALCLASISKAGMGFNYMGDPFISVEISSPIFVDVGETVQIPCLAYENIDDFSKIATPVVWRKENGLLDEHLNQDDGILTIKNIQSIDSSIYVCQSETSEHFKRKVFISVRDPSKILSREPSSNTEITIQPSHFTGYAGDIVVLACFNSVTTNASYAWSKYGTSSLPSHIIVRGGILIIQNSSIEDSGQYVCKSTSDGEKTISHGVDVIVSAHEFREITEMGSGVTEQEVVRTEIDATDSKTESEPLVVAETTTKVPAESKNEIQYKGSRTTEPLSSTETSVKTAFKLLPPLLTISPNSREVLNLNEGDQLMLICSAEGIPSPIVQWTAPDGIFKSETNIVAIEVSNVSGNESGIYVCEATSEAGTTLESIQVFVHSKQTETGVDNTIETPHSFECSNGEFACENGECIELSKMCDGFRDCSGGEDEDDGDLCPIP